MAKDIIFAAFYQAASGGTGVTGLTVTVDVHRVALADLANSEIVTAGAATELADGIYLYRVANADLATYYYYAIFKTTDATVAFKHVAGAQLDFSGNTGDTFARIGVNGAGLTALPAALLDAANGVETNYTLRQALRLILAASVGELSGASGTTVTIRDINDTVDRIVATVDSYGNRTAVTKDVT